MANNERFRMISEMKMTSEDSAEVFIYGAITSDKWTDDEVTAKDFDNQIKDAKKKGAKRVCARINSGGGDVFQAVAMRSILINCGMDISISIEGLCASAATLVASVPNAKVSIANGSMYMIHNPSTLAWGNADDLEKSVEILRKMESDFVGMYSEKTGIDEARIKEWMDAETWFTAEEAVKYGFCDFIQENTAEIAADAYGELSRIYARAPKLITADKETENVSNEYPTGTAGDSSEINQPGRNMEMDISEMTVEMLRNGNRDVYDAIVGIGATAERERISAIDEATPAGYEALATEAKRDGTSVNDFAMSVLKAIKAKGQAFMNERAEELKPTAKVEGGAEIDNDATAQDEDKAAKEIARFASEAANIGMY